MVKFNIEIYDEVLKLRGGMRKSTSEVELSYYRLTLFKRRQCNVILKMLDRVSMYYC